MASRPSLLLAASLAGFACLQACGSTLPALPRALTVTPGERVQIALITDKGERVFRVQNASSGSRNEVYSDPKSQAWTKVLSDKDLQQLLDVLTAQGLFEHSTAAPTPTARETLMVENEGQRWYWAHNTSDLADLRSKFLAAESYFLTAWNQAVAYSSTSMSREDLEAARARAQRSSDEAQRKMRNLRGKTN